MYNVANSGVEKREELTAEGCRYRSVLTLLDVRQPDAQIPGLGTSDSLRPIGWLLAGMLKERTGEVAAN